MSETRKPRTIVIDSGAYLTRVGISGSDVPEETFPTVVGRERYGAGALNIYIGDDADEKRSTLDLSYPVKEYSITNMEDMGRIWEYCYLDVLGCDTLDGNPVMLTDGPADAAEQKKMRTKLAEYMFETAKVPAFYMAMQQYLASLSLEKTTALVVDVGDSIASTVPVVDGAVVPEGIITTTVVSGRNLTDNLMKMLNDRDDVTISDRETVNTIKEKMGYVAWDYEEEFKWADPATKDYTLPDGKVIELGSERFRCAEPLFQTSLLGTEANGGIHKMAHESIQRCDPSVRASLYDAIVLAGGSTLFSKTSERLKREVKTLAGDGTEVTVLAPPTRAWSAWLGGSLLAEWDGFPEMTVSKEDYRENGAEIVTKKCIN